MSGKAALGRSDIKVTCGTVHGVRVQHIKVRRGVSLDPEAAQLLKDFFAIAEYVDPGHTAPRVDTVDPKWPIAHSVCVRPDFPDEICKRMGNAQLDSFASNLLAAPARRAPKFDHRDPHRRPAALRGQTSFA